MNRRASLPGADELFRSTSGPGGGGADRGPAAAQIRPLRSPDPQPAAEDPASESADTPTEASGRVRHDEKITVYLTSQELLDLEQARLRLKAEFGISIDRGRIVREAVGQLLTDLHDQGPDAAIVRRLT